MTEQSKDYDKMQWDHLEDMTEAELRNVLYNLESDYNLAEEVQPGAGALLVKKMLKIALFYYKEYQKIRGNNETYTVKR